MANQPPLLVASVQFAFDGNPAVIPLRDPTTLDFLGTSPEWTRTGSRQPAAFIGGSRPQVRVTFQLAHGTPTDDRPWRIGARGVRGHGLVERKVHLVFDEDGQSEPVDFRFVKPVPRGIGSVRRHWQWYAERDGQHRAVGVTRHHVYHTQRRAIKPAVWAVTSERQHGPFGNPDAPWVYLPLMHWTCRWAAGRQTDKSICDAIIANVRRSGLRYAVTTNRTTVREGLLRRAGLFQGTFRLDPSHGMPHAMPPEEVLRCIAVDALGRWNARKHRDVIEHVADTAEREMVAEIARAALRRGSRARSRR